MNIATKMIIVLTVITAFAGGILSTWDGFTKPKIEAYRLQELKKAIAEVLPAHESYEEIVQGETVLYLGKKSDLDEPVGIAFEAVGSGFQGKISMMVGVSIDFNQISGIKILEQIETPGLGTKIVEDPSNKQDRYWFTNQFKDLQTEPVIEVVKNKKPTKPTEIEAITGATISSKAVVTILNNKLLMAKNTYQKM